jgi:hypothetical protein
MTTAAYWKEAFTHHLPDTTDSPHDDKNGTHLTLIFDVFHYKLLTDIC